MKIEETLELLNFSKNEIKVYLTLLKIGRSKAGAIAKHAMMDRSSTYAALDSLLKKGMASYVVEVNKKIFTPSNPNKLLDYLKEKEELAKRAIPQLDGLFHQQKEKKDITLYRGYKGIKTVFQNIIREEKENLYFGSEGQFSERMPYYAPHFIKELETKNIKTKSIIRQGRKKKSSKTTNVRYFPSEVKSNVATNIFGDHIAIIIWSDIPEAIVIKNKIAADSYRSYFNYMWKNSKK